ncbi:ATP-binding cassette domain-containing protein, partial [Pseudomonadota bacterium]|nr:ATP-binding cassette domain-containing protein [Pseudomonadota bacterium]
VITITHDRYFLDEVAGWILELDRGEGIPYKGNYSEWLEQKQKRLELEGKIEEARKRKLNEELEWIKSAPRARQAKSKARISSYEELVAQEQNKEINTSNLVIPPAPRLGSEVINFNNVSKSFDDKLLIDNLSFKLPPGGIVGVIGANGAGKTTLFRLITKEENPNNGDIIIGETVSLNYVDQSRDLLKPKHNVWESICDGLDEIQIGKKTIQSRAYVGQFNFKGSDQQKIVSHLSGGERNRVHLAKMLKTPGNVLLLDEPTNDLDVDTLRALEEAILAFSGCVVVISHDRWFLNKLATHILAFEGGSHVEWFEGNYQDYEQDKKRRLGEDSLNPKRIKYKPISR